jgi:tRNA pseudouridine55 synthase
MGMLLVNKPAGISSFGIIEALQRELLEKSKREAGPSSPGVRKRDLPKMGHGGTLDPFATGLLLVCVGRGVKLSRYFLGSNKTYEGVIRFGETTIPGDPTEEISERSEHVPATLEEIQTMAHRMTLQPYLQTPPMHSAKKKNGKPLYELARQGIEVERAAKVCQLFSFEIFSYENRRVRFRVVCSSGTYIRTLSQDLGKLLGSVAMLDTLHRSASGIFNIDQALTLDQILQATRDGKAWDTLPCWVPFHEMLKGYDSVEARPDEALALTQGRQEVLVPLLARAGSVNLKNAENAGSIDQSHIVIYSGGKLVAVASRTHGVWGLERVFID